MESVVDRVSLSAGRGNIEACVQLAVERGLGIEVMAFAFPDVLDSNWREVLRIYKQLLEPVPGRLTMHAAFMDMVSGSPDERINEVCRQRYLHGLHVATELGADLMVVHANFIGSIHNTVYRKGWHKRNVEFWLPMVESAYDAGVTIALENMWEFDPTIITDLLAAVDHPSLRMCLDVGHAHLFSDKQYDLKHWFDTVQPWLVHMHVNNNNGIIDEHHGFNYVDGVLNYHDVLPFVRQLPHQPSVVLEMDRVKDMHDSLVYFELPESVEQPAD